MKLLFSYTGPIIVDKDGNYYSRDLTNDVLNRYFIFAEEIFICTRVSMVSEEDELKKYTKINLSNIKIIDIINVYTLKGFIMRKRHLDIKIMNIVKKCDVVIVRLPCLIGSAVAYEAKRQKKPYLVELVGCPFDAFWNHSLKGKVMSPYIWYITRYAVQHASYSLYVTQEFLQRRYPCNGKAIGCSDVSLKEIEEKVLKNRLIKIRKIKDKKSIIIGTIGAIDVKYKGQSDVIKAISKLNGEGFNFEYHLIGGGDKKYLSNIATKYKISKKVKFLGLLPHEKVFEYIDNIDIYIQPSRTEGLPRALIEAMSKGCPSIGSNVGGVPELLNSMYIFKKRSTKDICNKIKKMDTEYMSRAANNNFNEAQKYNKKNLEKIRTDFYIEYVKDVLELGENK